MIRLAVSEYRFLLIDFEEEVFLDVATFKRKTYVKELTLDQIREVISAGL